MSRIFKTIIFIFALSGVTAQSLEQGQYAIDYDTNFIADYRHKMSVSALFEFKNYVLAVFRPNQKLLSYSSNLPKPLYGINFSYRWLNFSFSTAIPKLSVSNPNFETSKGFAFALSTIGRKVYLRHFYEQYSGYRLINPEEVDSKYYETFNQVPDYPKLLTRTYFLTLYYGFNGNKFSYRNLVWQSENQKKSAGTFLVGASGGFKWIDSEKIIIPTTFENIEPVGVVEMNYFNFGINAGYAYTLVIPKNFNISLLVVPGLQYINGYYKYNTGINQDFETKIGMNIESRLQLGYNSQNFFGNISYSAYALRNWISDAPPIGSVHNYFKVSLGYHFKVKPIKLFKPFGLSN